jgi:hypothetical protein
MAITAHKTPGVYISEPDSFPPSIVGVPTAIPAFIGYTEKARDKTKDLQFAPIRISSMAEYHAKFGRGFHESYYLIPEAAAPPPTDEYVGMVTLHEGGGRFRLMEDGQANFNLYTSLRMFYENGGGECYIVSCGTFIGDDGKTPVSITKESLDRGLDEIANEVGPTMLVLPDAVLLTNRDEFNALAVQMLMQCMTLQDRVAILDVWGTHALTDPTKTPDLIKDFREGLAGAPPESLRYGIAYFPNLQTSIMSANDVSISMFSKGDNLANLQTALTAAADHIYPPGATGERNPRAVLISEKYISQIGQSQPDSDVPKGTPAADRQMTHGELTQALLANLPPLADLFQHVADSQNMIPPSGAMAGVFTQIDTTRGVWNAPANVGIAGLIAPTVAVSHHQQEDLNVPAQGKAVNAIRSFPGRGPLVWGARTLDSNSNDWRYIQVRRTMIYVEQSVKTALQTFVFAPNTAQTWTTVVSAIESFLHGLWSAGGLMGASPAEAYSVQCGLGSTMTPDDILNGIMTVHIVLQMVHPAEFIELVFKQQMQAAS